MTRRGCVWTVLAAALAGAAAAGEGEQAGGLIIGRNVFETFQRGGMVMWPILASSVAGLAFVLERLVGLRRSAVFPPKLLPEVRPLVQAGKTDEAMRLCRERPSPFARIVEACLGRAGASGFEMEAALEEAGARVLYDLRRNCRPLGVIADVAPLLGLMGTVTGMIKAFEVVAKTGALGRTEMLAAGIAEALLTTAFGLMVAVPAMIFYQYFRAKADGLLRAMEDACLELLNDLRKSGDGR